MVWLLRAVALTVSHGFLGRCSDVAWALAKLGIDVGTLADAQVMPSGMDEVRPCWHGIALIAQVRFQLC